MTVEVKPFRSESDYEAALAEIERLWGAKAGTAEGDKLDILATLVDAYESEYHPFNPPDPIEAIEFCMESQGLTRRDLEAMLGTRARTRRQGSEPQARPLDRHDPALARSARYLGRGADPPGSKDCRLRRRSELCARRAGRRRRKMPAYCPLPALVAKRTASSAARKRACALLMHSRCSDAGSES